MMQLVTRARTLSVVLRGDVEEVGVAQERLARRRQVALRRCLRDVARHVRQQIVDLSVDRRRRQLEHLQRACVRV